MREGTGSFPEKSGPLIDCFLIQRRYPTAGAIHLEPPLLPGQLDARTMRVPSADHASLPSLIAICRSHASGIMATSNKRRYCFLVSVVSCVAICSPVKRSATCVGDGTEEGNRYYRPTDLGVDLAAAQSTFSDNRVTSLAMSSLERHCSIILDHILSRSSEANS